ncbi:MAG: winged helix-turn-helix transcriptional regulator [Culicoidibacterales bacterium]
MTEITSRLCSCKSPYTLKLIQGKYKLEIIHLLSSNTEVSYSQLKKQFPNISDRTLSRQLNSLIHDQIIDKDKHMENNIPVSIYFLTPFGDKLRAINDSLHELGIEHENL